MRFYVYGYFKDFFDVDEEEFKKYLEEDEAYMKEPEGPDKEAWREKILEDFVCANWTGENAELTIQNLDKVD